MPTQNHPGSLSYDQTGEFFFLPFAAADIVSTGTLQKVKFIKCFLVTLKLRASKSRV